MFIDPFLYQSFCEQISWSVKHSPLKHLKLWKHFILE